MAISSPLSCLEKQVGLPIQIRESVVSHRATIQKIIEISRIVFAVIGVAILAGGAVMLAGSIFASAGGILVAAAACLLVALLAAYIYERKQVAILQGVCEELRGNGQISWSEYRTLCDNVKLLKNDPEGRLLSKWLGEERAADFLRALAARKSGQLAQPEDHKKRFFQRMEATLAEVAGSFEGAFPSQEEVEAWRDKLTTLYNYFRGCLAHETRDITLITSFQQAWQRVNDCFEGAWNRAKGSSAALHLFCGCHLAPAGATLHPTFSNVVIEGVDRGVIETSPIASPERQNGCKPAALIFTIQVGTGNVMISRVIAKALAGSWHVQIATSVSSFEEKGFTFCSRRGWWRLMAPFMQAYPLSNRLFTAELRKRRALVQAAVQKYDPQAIFLTSPNAVVAAQEAASERKIQLVGVSSDFTTGEYHILPDGLRGLKEPQQLHMLVPTADLFVSRYIAGKVPREQICPAGYPINQVFRLYAEKKQDAGEVAAIKARIGTYFGSDLSLSAEDDAIVVMIGSQGWGDALQRYAKKLATMTFEKPLHMFFCCGSNEDAYHTISKLTSTPKVILHPLMRVNSEAIAALYTISKALVTKPGGSTVAESIVMKLPLIIDNTAGHLNVLFWERENRDFIVRAGAGQSIDTLDEIGTRLQSLLDERYIYPPITLPDFAKKFGEFMGVIYPPHELAVEAS